MENTNRQRKLKLLENKLRKMVREELIKEENLGYGIKSNISEKWIDDSVIMKDIQGYLAECFDAGGKELVNDAIDAIKKAIANSTKYTR